MTVRSWLTAEKALLVVLAGGLASFVVVHSVALLLGGSEQTTAMFRRLWFLGLAAAVVPYVLARI